MSVSDTAAIELRSELFQGNDVVEQHLKVAAQQLPNASIELCVRLLLCSSITQGVRIWGGSGEPLLALISVSPNSLTHRDEWTIEVQSTWCPQPTNDDKSMEAMPPTSPISQRFVNDDALRVLQVLWTAYPNAPCLCFNNKEELMRAVVMYREAERALPLCPTALATLTNPMEGSPSLSWIPAKEWEDQSTKHLIPNGTT